MRARHSGRLQHICVRATQQLAGLEKTNDLDAFRIAANAVYRRPTQHRRLRILLGHGHGSGRAATAVAWR